MAGRTILAWITGAIIYTVLIWIPSYGLVLAPIIAAIGIATYKIEAGKAAGVGFLAGLTGLAINLAYAGGLEGLRIIAGIGGGIIALLVVAYHFITPALLSYSFAYALKGRS